MVKTQIHAKHNSLKILLKIEFLTSNLRFGEELVLKKNFFEKIGYDIFTYNGNPINYLRYSLTPLYVLIEIYVTDNTVFKLRLVSPIYDVIMSFTDDVMFGPFRLSLISLRNTERFWVNLNKKSLG